MSKVLEYTKALILRPKILDCLIEIQGFRKSEKWGNALNDIHNDLDHLTVKGSLHTLNIYPSPPPPSRPRVCPFHSTISRFRHTRISKVWEMHRITSKFPWTLKQLKVPYVLIYTMYLPPPEDHIWAPCFPLGPPFFEIQSSQKSKKIRHTPSDLKMTLNN